MLTRSNMKSTELLSEAHGAHVEGLDVSLWEHFCTQVSAYPDREALVSLWQSPQQYTRHPPVEKAKELQCSRLSYLELWECAESLASVLQSLGCGHGGHIVVVLGNSIEWALLFWACTKIGATFIALDPGAISDMQEMLSFATPRLVVVQDAVDAAAVDALGCEKLRDSIRMQCAGPAVEGWIGLLPRSASRSDRPAAAVARFIKSTAEQPRGGVALVIFTSGTTGAPKACPHTQANLVSQTDPFDRNPDVSVIDRWLVHTPVCHMFGINNALRAWRTGGAVVFPSQAFDLASTMRALVEEQCTVMSATPTLVRTLLAQPDLPAAAALALDFVTLGGTIISETDVQLCRHRLHATTAIQAYGLSEGAPLISWARDDALLRDNGYHAGVGRVLPGASVRICRRGTREVVRRGQVGELHVGGPSVIAGYIEYGYGDGGAGAGAGGGAGGGGRADAEEVKEGVFYHAASRKWFATGDQARMDQSGVIYVLGRFKDMIIRGGVNIQPARIEAMLLERHGAQAQVVGVPDAMVGEVAVAVVRELPPSLSCEQLVADARNLGPAFALDGAYTMEQLRLSQFPQTATGKVRKDALRDVVAKFRKPVEAAGLDPVSEASMRLDRDLDTLTEMLLAAWHAVAGIRPPPAGELPFYFSDSLTLLRYCDAASRRCGTSLYLQDLALHDTVSKQATLLQRRRAQSQARLLPAAEALLISPASPGRPRLQDDEEGQLRLQLQQLSTSPSSDPELSSLFNQASSPSLHLSLCGTKEPNPNMAHTKTSDTAPGEVIPIRSSLVRMVFGQRPQSYNLRVVFKVRDETPEQVRNGLEKALASNQMLRTVLKQNKDGTAYLVVMKPSARLYSELIEEHTVASERDVTHIQERNPKVSRSSAFMFKADIVTVKSTGHQYLALTYNHSIVDAMTLLGLHHQVDRCIKDSSWHNPEQTSYQQFSDLHSQYKGSKSAQESVDYHVRRLRGISQLWESQWPQQRAPGWMIANDSDSEHSAVRGDIRDKVWDEHWKGLESEFAFPRRSRVVRLPYLRKLQKQHGITPAVFAQSAVVLFNCLQTQSQKAIFTTWESGRSWPFVPDWVAETLPSPTSINGPTFNWILNVFKLVEGETLAAFLKRMSLEQQETQKHVHAPWEMVIADLQDEAIAAEDASFRQSFVWDVSIGLGASQEHRNDYEVLEPIARYDWADCGFVWSAFMLDSEQMRFVASWDTAQMNASEVDDCCDSLVGVLNLLGDELNWNKRVEDIFMR
ncbi:Acyl-CoA ligase sidI [Paramyrothecium foliicola]|nr:Acyl-CoA ligase sidI [Paramyrothecium foliicola]